MISTSLLSGCLAMSGYQEGLLWVRGGTAGIGFALALMGVGLLVQKPKDNKPESPGMRTTARVLGIVLIAAGIVLPIYLWMSI